MGSTLSTSPSWRAALRHALRRRLGRGRPGDARIDLGQAVDLAIQNGADRRLRDAAPDAAISKMLRLMEEQPPTGTRPAE